LLERSQPARRLRILDCACGIGTQALGLASRGHFVVATDLSAAAVARARREATQRALSLTFDVADMCDLSTVAESGFDVVLAADNALPHLNENQLQRAASSVAAKLAPGGTFVAESGLRSSLPQRPTVHPTVHPPAFFTDRGRRRIVHQVWDWIDDRTDIFHLYITR